MCVLRLRTVAIRAIRCRSIRFFDDRRAIENEILAFLVQDSEAIEPQGIAKKIDRRIGLFDNPEQRSRVGNRNGATFGAAAEIFEKQFELLGQVVRRCEIFRHFARRVAGQDEALVALSLEENSFEDVLTEIDANYRISAPRHGGGLDIAGSVPGISLLCPGIAPYTSGKVAACRLTDRVFAISKETPLLDQAAHFGWDHRFPCRIAGLQA